MTSLIPSMSRKSWRVCVFVFNVKDEACFEIRNNMKYNKKGGKRFSFLRGKGLPLCVIQRVVVYIFRTWLTKAWAPFMH